MDDETVILVAATMLMLLLLVVEELDGRSVRRPDAEKITVHSDFYVQFRRQNTPTKFKEVVRCTPEAFEYLVKFIQPKYDELFQTNYQHPTCAYPFSQRLAVYLAYLGKGTGKEGAGISGAAGQLGMSKSAAIRYCAEMETVICSLASEVIRPPSVDDSAGWRKIVNGFYKFSNTCGLVDGSLIKVNRFMDC
ncbi:Uncharacterized protein PBTT_10280 [Plasmodiophora brassicae]